MSKAKTDDGEPYTLKMKAKPNWEDMLPADAEDTPDRLRIAPELVPQGMSLLWVTDSVYGQDMAQHRSVFEKRGWTPVNQSDFDGVFDGMFMPKGREGEVKVDGLVLMTRPVELTERALRIEKARANEQVAIKEQALRGGNLDGVTLDAQHPTAVRSNTIRKSMERIQIPD